MNGGRRDIWSWGHGAVLLLALWPVTGCDEIEKGGCHPSSGLCGDAGTDGGAGGAAGGAGSGGDPGAGGSGFGGHAGEDPGFGGVGGEAGFGGEAGGGGIAGGGGSIDAPCVAFEGARCALLDDCDVNTIEGQRAFDVACAPESRSCEGVDDATLSTCTEALDGLSCEDICGETMDPSALDPCQPLLPLAGLEAGYVCADEK